MKQLLELPGGYYYIKHAMRSIKLSALFILLSSLHAFSFNQDSAAKQIDQQVKLIDSLQHRYTVITLNGESLLHQAFDHGSEVSAWFLNDTLVKIIESIGVSYANLEREYYYVKQRFVYARHSEWNYAEKIDSLEGFVGWDYDKPMSKGFEASEYYVSHKGVTTVQLFYEGKPLVDKITYRPFTDPAQHGRLIEFFENYYHNLDMNNQLQGNWKSGDQIWHISGIDIKQTLGNTHTFGTVIVLDSMVTLKTTDSNKKQKFRIIAVDNEMLELENQKDKTILKLTRYDGQDRI
ncbi:hypothetical protein GYB22_01240 [bacterium]|nr:hypothetical protein [bacterium]